MLLNQQKSEKKRKKKKVIDGPASTAEIPGME